MAEDNCTADDLPDDGLSDWQRAELDARLARHRANPSDGEDWEEIKKRLSHAEQPRSDSGKLAPIPTVDPCRKQAVEILLRSGCRLVPDISRIPEHLRNLPPAEQQDICNNHIELLRIEMVKVPKGATCDPGGLRNFTFLPEIEYLRFVGWAFEPEQCASLGDLPELSTLEIVGDRFDDRHCAQFPFMPTVRRFYLYSGSVTAEGRAMLSERMPSATLNLLGWD